MLTTSITPSQALAGLMEGNRRYLANQPVHPRQGHERRMEVLSAPRPAAALLSCADSRVPPEILFDQGVGDLFVIRNAGNLVDEIVLGTLEFGVTTFQIPLILVLGHTLCGAVMAAVAGSQPAGHIGSITTALQPAVEISQGLPGDPVINATIANVRRMVKQIQTCPPVLSELVQSGKIQVVGGLYHVDSGVVELLS